jgi:hypothetical protein
MKFFNVFTFYGIWCVPSILGKLNAWQDSTTMNDPKSISLPSVIHSKRRSKQTLGNFLQTSLTPAMTRMVTKESNIESDESICESFVQGYFDDWAENTCQRIVDRNGLEPGVFLVEYKFDYCDDCYPPTELCGYEFGNYTFLDNYASFENILANEEYYCIQYTSGKEYTMCIKSVLDETSDDALPESCQIHIGDQVCTSCDFIFCHSGIEYDESWTFDCSNIDGLYAMNTCDYEPYTNITAPAMDKFDPLVFIRPDGGYSECSIAPDTGTATRRPLNIVASPAIAPKPSSNFPPSVPNQHNFPTTGTPSVVGLSSSIESVSTAESSRLSLIVTSNGLALLVTGIVLFFLV